MNGDLVIHINHPDRTDLAYALGYVRNYGAAMGERPGRVVVLVNGPAVEFFRRTDGAAAEIAGLARRGI